MIRDYITHEIQQTSNLIAELQAIERELKATRGQGRRGLKRAAEQKREAILNRASSPSAIYQFLAATKDPDEKDTSDTAFRTKWQEKNQRVECLQASIKSYYQENFERPEIDLAVLPAYAFALQFTFTLAQSYISRDEQDFYIIDNPVRKEKIFGLPYIASTSWKGSLRASLWQSGYKSNNQAIDRLFGNEKGEEEQAKFHAGRLYFFPTFFTQKDLEIINPHDRQKQAGSIPILFESAPIGAKGIFTLLYVPFDRVGKDEKETQKQAAQDLSLVAQGLQAMFCISGFGAKTSSGCGLATEDVFNGVLRIRARGFEKQQEKAAPAPSSPAPSLARYLEAPGRLKPEYLTRAGIFLERSEAELKKMSKGDRQVYDKARTWWEREGKQLDEQAKQPPAAEPPIIEQQPIAWPQWKFSSFQQLIDQTNNIAKQSGVEA
jgi:CRISPR-associated protein Cmr2